MKDFQIVEYIWVDASGAMRGKTRVLTKAVSKASELPVWSFDGSSTGQAVGHDSDIFIVARRLYKDPFRDGNNLIALCECFKDAELTQPHETNTRHSLDLIAEHVKAQEPWFGVEQEYVLYNVESGLPLGWKSAEDPGAGPQGPYYCSAGGDRAFGRQIVEAHMTACLVAGVHYYGANAEVMPSQWEFQIGTADPLTVADDLWLARYLLARISEKFGASVNYHPKPKQGDWNGSGGHVNFSTAPMRADGGLAKIEEAMRKLELTHVEDLRHYGEFNELRLTGLHETSSMEQFSWGVGNRGRSARITKQVVKDGKGYLEDRRPSSNLDPYRVFDCILRATTK